MPDDKPLEEVTADQTTDAIFQMRTAMIARGDVMKYSHVREVILKSLRAFKALLLAPVGDSDGLTVDERIYQAYPRKVGKKTALKAIAVALRAIPASELLAKVQAYKQATDTWPQTERKFIPFPATWFNRGSYMDDPKEWERGKADAAPIEGRFQPSASLGSLQLQLKRIEDEMESILYPGGAAFKTIPTGDKLVRFQELQKQRENIKRLIANFGQ